MAPGVASAIANLVSAGWSFDPTTPPDIALPRALGDASETLVAWMSSFSELSSPDDAVWFLGRGDYVARSGEGFAWNAFERISSEAAETNQEANEVADFWNAHCPILLSVRGAYSYLAVRRDGVIVHGAEPEFEDATAVAPSFEALLDSIARGPADGQEPVERLVFGHERA